MSLSARPVTELPRSIPVGLARRTMRVVQRMRTHVVFGAVLVLFAALLARLVRVQLVDGDVYRSLVARQSREYDVQPLRGPILDRNGRPLAISRPVRHVVVEAGGTVNARTGVVRLAIDDVGRFAMNLSDLLEGVPSAMDLRNAIQEKRTHLARNGSGPVTVRRNIDDPRVISRLDAARLPGLVIKQGDRRDYPNGSWGGMLVGVARSNDAFSGLVGSDGIEQGLDGYLAGSPTKRRVPVDGRGRRFVTPKTIDAGDDADGRTVWLSLDLVLQGWCEQALDRLMDEWSPRGAVAIVMDPATGDVLAMAQRPTFDPTMKDQVAGRNLATQWRTEVGSTFKPVTACRALELGVVGMEEVFTLPRERTFTSGRSADTIRDSHDGGERIEGGTLVQVIAQSNNPDIAELAWRIGPEGMKKLVKDLQVEEAYPLVGYLRENKGFVPWKQFFAFDHLRLGFGHSMEMTPLRLTSIFCAFARDDFRPVTPRLVLAVGGQAVPELELGPTLLTDPRKRDLIRRALRAVVTEGTAKKTVKSDLYAIAGKTGTAKRPEVFGKDTYYSSSFVGFAPVDHPRLVCLVMAQDPHLKEDGSKPYGGAVAGPAVRYVLERALEEYLRVPPDNAPVTPKAQDALAPARIEAAHAEAGRDEEGR